MSAPANAAETPSNNLIHGLVDETPGGWKPGRCGDPVRRIASVWHLIYVAARFATVALLQGKDRCCLETVGG